MALGTSPASSTGCRISPSSASTRSGSAVGIRPRWPMAGTTSATTAISTLTSARSNRRTRLLCLAHDHGLRVLIDLVPSHSSDRHPLFQAALATGPSSTERELYIFRDGASSNGSTPPNNWRPCSAVGAWGRPPIPTESRGQWYLHLFAPEQPDWNWENPAVAGGSMESCDSGSTVGSMGFGSMWPSSMAKAPGLPDMDIDPETGEPLVDVLAGTPCMNQPHVHDILRRWRARWPTRTPKPTAEPGCSCPRPGWRRRRAGTLRTPRRVAQPTRHAERTSGPRNPSAT